MEDIIATGRILERIMVVVFAGISIILGYKLFTKGIHSPQTANFSFKDLSIDFTKVGPGIFFSLFGTAVLVSAHYHALTYVPPAIDDPESKGRITYISSGNTDLAKSLSTSIDVLKQKQESLGDKPEAKKIQQAKVQLAMLRKQILLEMYPEAFSRYDSHFMDSVIKPSNYTDEERALFQEIHELMRP